MSEPYLTMTEIEKQYPNEWVLIADPTHRRRSLEVTGGRVVVHCADRADFIRRVGEWDEPGYKRAAVQYVGKFPEEDDAADLPAEPEPALR
ncbi:MAG TPA: hypothetical protein VMZ71_11850 [Gemmataceae bacterium]|nr:hypothetical protein [Gemmataceae bacterium]